MLWTWRFNSSTHGVYYQRGLIQIRCQHRLIFTRTLRLVHGAFWKFHEWNTYLKYKAVTITQPTVLTFWVFSFALIMIIPEWNNPSWLTPALGISVFPILRINLYFLKPPRTSTELRRLCRVKTRRVGKLEEEPGRRVALHYRLQSGLSHWPFYGV